MVPVSGDEAVFNRYLGSVYLVRKSEAGYLVKRITQRVNMTFLKLKHVNSAS